VKKKRPLLLHCRITSGQTALRQEQGIVVAVIKLEHLQIGGGVGAVIVGPQISIAGAATFQMGITLLVAPPLS